MRKATHLKVVRKLREKRGRGKRMREGGIGRVGRDEGAREEHSPPRHIPSNLLPPTFPTYYLHCLQIVLSNYEAISRLIH